MQYELMQQRIRELEADIGQQNKNSIKRVNNVLNTLQSVHNVVFVNSKNAKRKIKKLRDLKSKDVGHLVNVRGTVVKVSGVNSKMVVGTYICETCSSQILSRVRQQMFKPPNECQSVKCK